MHRIFISAPQHGSHSPIRLCINGRESEHPVNTEITINDDQLEALQNSGYVVAILASDTAVEQESAPGDSGGAGDADAGGASGERATGETAGQAAPSTDAPAITIPPEFLDRSVVKIVAELDGKDAAFLTQLRKDEETGKTRVSLLAAIDERLKALAPPQA